jgi:hypothetical protein
MESSHVDREYLDEALRRIATDAAYQPQDWNDREIADFRLLVQCARAARLDTDLRNTRMLGIEPEGTGDEDRARATLTSGRVVYLTFKNTESQGSVLFDLVNPEMGDPR